MKLDHLAFNIVFKSLVNPLWGSSGTTGQVKKRIKKDREKEEPREAWNAKRLLLFSQDHSFPNDDKYIKPCFFLSPPLYYSLLFLLSSHLFSVSLYPSYHCLLFNALPPVTHSVIKGFTIKATVYKQTTLALYWDQFNNAPPALWLSGDQTATDSGSVSLVFGVSHGEVYIRHNFICQMLLEADQSTAVPQRISEHSYTHVQWLRKANFSMTWTSIEFDHFLKTP